MPKQPEAQTELQYQIVIVGGGTAGITVASQLLTAESNLDLAIIEPSSTHYYQPAWTLVGGGVYRAEDTAKETKKIIDDRITWIQDYCQQFDPANHKIITRQGTTITYDYLIVAAGIQIDWHLIKGLPEALGKNGVCSNYDYKQAPLTWETLKNFSGGKAIFTYPNTAIKCAGAPQKIMYLADETFRKNGVREKSQILYCTATGGIFGVPVYAKPLMEIVQRKQIDLKVMHDLIEIQADKKQAVFNVTTNEGITQVAIDYDMIHVTPPMSSPDFIKHSPLADAGGWVDVDKYTLQHNTYPNVFSLGDASSLPTSKTAAAVRAEAPVVVQNLLSSMAGKSLEKKYDGYACCPLVTGYGKVIFAEFDYDKNPSPTFPLDPTQERYSMWLLKKYGLPYLYWQRMLKGKTFERYLLRN
jgi:sulfide:quinone oxidoreductase